MIPIEHRNMQILKDVVGSDISQRPRAALVDGELGRYGRNKDIHRLHRAGLKEVGVGTALRKRAHAIYRDF